MFRYDYATFSLSIQNVEDVLVLLMRLLVRRRGNGEGEKMRVSVYGCAVESQEIYV